MSTSPVRPTVPEGTDPVVALRQLQEQLASARYSPLGKGDYLVENRTRDEGARDAERTAGMNLLPVVNAVEELVAELRRQVAEPFALAGEPGWYGSRWVCPVEGCSWDHREPNAVSSVDVAEAERVRGLLIGHLLDFHTGKELASALLERWTEWPAHCSEWIAGADPENPDMCPEYASPGGDKCALHRPDHVEYIADQMRRRGWRSPGMPPDDFNRRVTALREALFGPGDAEHIATAMRGPRPSAETLAEILNRIPSPMRGDYISTDLTTYTYDGQKWVRAAGVFGKTSSASTGLTVPAEVSYPGGVNEELERELANRIAERLAELDEVTAERGPVQFPGPFGMMTPQERQNMVHCGHPAARPSARVAYPPSPGARWLYGFGPRDAETAWRCQRCMTTQVGNPPACVSCGHTVLDPGHWEADEPAPAEACERYVKGGGPGGRFCTTCGQSIGRHRAERGRGVLELPGTVSQETADRISATLAGHGMPEVVRSPFRIGDLVRWNGDAHPWFEGRIVGETTSEERFAGDEKWNVEVTHLGSMYVDKPEQLGCIVHVTEERLTLVARTL